MSRIEKRLICFATSRALECLLREYCESKSLFGMGSKCIGWGKVEYS